MPLIDTTSASLPSSWQGFKDEIPQVGESKYLLFISDNDNSTGQPWCPDVRAALPVLRKFFDKRDIEVSTIKVGSLPVWRDKNNKFRKNFGLTAIPALVKYTKTEDGVVQAQLLEDECKKEDKIKKFIQ
ncbi:hypothetical protein BX600DRAFT_450509 [Xylariales sp. PMI_506]|nr:hypothetical protein BX600DRAFT_450509 [Xylariales sp. PMI_506]